MKIEYTKAAIKVIGTLDRPTKRRICAAIEKLPQGDIKTLKGGEGTYRLRVGNWRILFSYPDAKTVLVEKIGPRGEIYKGV